jgi:ATP/maltotriose-dependent transcriptional regulator MalT
LGCSWWLREPGIAEIANSLHISQATVKSHLIQIFGKPGVSDRTAAVTEALKRGILRLDQ